MVRTYSSMLELGTILPDFDLTIVKGTKWSTKNHQLSRFRLNKQGITSKALLIMIICAHCPFVKHVESELTRLDIDYGDEVQIIAVSSNSLITHPQDAPDELSFQANKNGWRFPYLFDEHQGLVKALKAACTPEFFLFASEKDGDNSLRYRGQLDNSRPGNDLPVDGKDLRAALDAVLNEQQVSNDQKQSIGCNIKWHPGQEPPWFG